MCFGYKFFVVFMNWGMPQKNKSAIIFIHVVVNIFDWHKYFFNPFLANAPILYLLKSFSWCEFKLYIIVLLTGIPLKIVFLETYCSTKLFWDINSQNSHLMLRDEERVFKKARCFYLKTSLSMRAFLEETFFFLKKSFTWTFCIYSISQTVKKSSLMYMTTIIMFY